MGKSKNTTSRRKEVRKLFGREKVHVSDYFKRSDVLFGILLIIGFVLITGTLALQKRRAPIYKPGQIVDRPFVARVDFKSQDPEKTRLLREEARSNQRNIYIPNKNYLDNIYKSLISLPAAVAGVEDTSGLSAELQKQFGITEQALLQLKKFEQTGEGKSTWTRLVDVLAADLKTRPFLTPERFQSEQLKRTGINIILEDQRKLPVDTNNLVSIDNQEEVTRRIAILVKNFPGEIQPVLNHFFVSSGKATYHFDQQASDLIAKQAEDAVQTQVVQHLANSVLVKAGVQLQEKGGFELLQAESTAYLNYLWTTNFSTYFMIHLSPFILILLLTISLSGYIHAVMPRISHNPLRAMALACLLLLGLATAWVGVTFEETFHPGALLASTLFVSIILVIAYDQRFSVGVMVSYCLILGVVLQLSAGIVVINILGGMCVIGQLSQIKHRSTLGRAGLVTGLAMAVGVLVVGYTERHLVQGVNMLIVKQAIFALAMCVMTSFFVLGILPGVEKVFRVTTGMTLLELGDMNHPLLRRLQQTAPGTYNHSCTLAIISEAAAESIHANGLLCRVGAYFHDIGKMNKPKYFVENQGSGPNSHDKLSPAMSLLIIVGHVKDGIEMAREYALPRVLHHFIESHHGTTLVEYFYHAAVEQRSEDYSPEEIEFRYPGPKPQTREAAILMLCDAIESAARAMQEKSPARIEQLVHKIARKRLLDGQFDECELTLRQLTQIEQSITKTLLSIYHGRIKYPSEKKAQTDESSTQNNSSVAAG